MHKLTLPTLLAALAMVGCGQLPDPDRDDVRGKSIQLGIGPVVTDAIDVDAGDRSDWKMVASPAQGFLTFQVRWDDIDAIHGASVTVADKFGAVLERRSVDRATQLSEIVVRAERSYYFIKVEAERGGSIYSVVARHTVATDSTGPDSGPARPDFQ